MSHSFLRATFCTSHLRLRASSPIDLRFLTPIAHPNHFLSLTGKVEDD
ncbi:unnamed protein product [Rhodiola kirilowii]